MWGASRQRKWGKGHSGAHSRRLWHQPRMEIPGVKDRCIPSPSCYISSLDHCSVGESAFSVSSLARAYTRRNSCCDEHAHRTGAPDRASAHPKQQGWCCGARWHIVQAIVMLQGLAARCPGMCTSPRRSSSRCGSTSRRSTACSPTTSRTSTCSPPRQRASLWSSRRRSRLTLEICIYCRMPHVIYVNNIYFHYKLFASQYILSFNYHFITSIL